MGEDAAFDSAAASTLVNDLRRVFRSGRTRPLQWREEQLKAIVRMFTEREADLVAALDKDLGKPVFETYLGDIHVPIKAAKEAIANLKKWTAPQQALPFPFTQETMKTLSTNLENFPSESKTVPEPLGVVLNIAPWNYPYTLCFEPLIGIISAGNAAVLKPSELAPHTASLMVELVGAYLDCSAIRVVTGGVSVATALLEQRWDKIMYTGNTMVAKIVSAAAAKHLTPVLLELGGKNPVIVDSTANIAVAALRILSGRMLNSGQTCVSPEYVLAEKEVADKLEAEMKSVLLKWYGTNPEESTSLSRIINKRCFARVDALLTHAETAERIVYGGGRDEAKLFVGPTLLRDVPWDSPLMQQEAFAPILAIQTVSGMDEAFDIINDRPKPLSLYAFTSSKAFQERVVNETSAGAVCINDTVLHMLNGSLPFGGVGDSGTGSYHGRHSFDAFSHRKAVMIKRTNIDPPARFPPFTPFKADFFRALLNRDFVGLNMLLLGVKK